MLLQEKTVRGKSEVRSHPQPTSSSGTKCQILTTSYNRFSDADNCRDALERWGAFVDRLVHRSAFHLYLIGRRTDKGFNHMDPGDSVCATRVEEILEADH